jgi:hypothetical protein
MPRGAKLLLLGLGACLKFCLLLRYGPLPSDDTVEYAAIAHALLTNPDIVREIPGWSTQAMPMLAFRPYGYPALLALGQLMAGGWAYTVVVVLQLALSLYVGARLFDLALMLGKSTRLAAMATALYILSDTLLWDQSILSDSLYAGCFNLVILTLAECRIAGRTPRRSAAIQMGLIWGASILIREVGLYFTILPLILITLCTPRRAVTVAAFLLPVMALVGLYAGWNAYRTGGAPFVSVTGVANYLRPSFDIARRARVDVFDRPDDPAAVALRAAPELYVFPAQLTLLQQVHDQLRVPSPLAMERLELGEYLSLFRRHGAAYARYVAANLEPSSFGVMLFDPLSTLNHYFQFGVPPYRRVVPGTGLKSLRDLIEQGRFAACGLALLSLGAMLAATAIWIGSVGGLPILAIREYRQTRGLRDETIVALSMWFAFAYVAGLYALIHTETRLMLPVFPAGILVAAYVAAWMPARRPASADGWQPSADIAPLNASG